MNDRTRRHDPNNELELRLEAYARARLSPDGARIERMRAELMVAAQETLAERVPASPATLASLDDARRRRLLGGWRRTGVALLAASLTGIGLAGSAFAGSRAGGPLYQTRVWLETLALPSEANARTDAEMTRLEARLDDTRDAAARDDESGVAAALGAYRETVDEALSAAGSDHDRLGRLEIELMRHETVLETLAATLPSNAADAIHQVLDRAGHALDEIHDKDKPSDGSKPGQPGDKPGGGPPTQKPGGGPPTQKPAGPPTEKPGKPTQKPGHDRSPGADAPSNQGGATPRPGNTPRSGG